MALTKFSQNKNVFYPASHPVFDGYPAISLRYYGLAETGRQLGISAPAMTKKLKGKINYFLINGRRVISEKTIALEKLRRKGIKTMPGFIFEGEGYYGGTLWHPLDLFFAVRTCQTGSFKPCERPIASKIVGCVAEYYWYDDFLICCTKHPGLKVNVAMGDNYMTAWVRQDGKLLSGVLALLNNREKEGMLRYMTESLALKSYILETVQDCVFCV